MRWDPHAQVLIRKNHSRDIYSVDMTFSGFLPHASLHLNNTMTVNEFVNVHYIIPENKKNKKTTTV